MDKFNSQNRHIFNDYQPSLIDFIDRNILRSQPLVDNNQMTVIKTSLLEKFADRLFTDATEKESFIMALQKPMPNHPCILWCRESSDRQSFREEFPPLPPIEWQPESIDRLPWNSQPGKHTVHQNGEFYCLDLSSIFAAVPMLAIKDKINTIFDVCAAPGGKGIFAWRNLNPQTIVANETIGKRLGMLISNYQRCRIDGSTIINLDPRDLAELFPQTTDLAIVDAPCSGQSLLAKGMKVPGCFHHRTIDTCANRQKRILANTIDLLLPGGYLIYSTCTYAIEENEKVCTWLLKKFPELTVLPVSQLAAYRSTYVDFPCYRLFPQSGLGAGAFTILFQLQGDLAKKVLSGTSPSIEDRLAAYPRIIKQIPYFN